jgi:cation transport ATPase
VIIPTGNIVGLFAAAQRDGRRRGAAGQLSPVHPELVIEEGDRVCADARLLDGDLEVDLSTLTGESLRATRSADLVDTTGPVLEAGDLVFSGTTCTQGEARALVTATGMRTKFGRIAALTQRTARADSPLERQVKRAAWLIVLVAAGLGWSAAVTFAIGLIVANVPEGLFPPSPLPWRSVFGIWPGCGGQAPVGGGDAGVDHGDLHGQDRHADREPDAGDQSLAARR